MLEDYLKQGHADNPTAQIYRDGKLACRDILETGVVAIVTGAVLLEIYAINIFIKMQEKINSERDSASEAQK